MARIARRFGEADNPSGDGVRSLPSAPESAAGSNSAAPPAARGAIRIDSSGRYVVGGFSFASLDQAVDYAARRFADTGAGSSDDIASAGVPPPATGGIAEVSGRYVVGAFSFSSLELAREYQAERAASASAPPSPEARPPAPATGHASIRIDSNGRYKVGGFAFATLEQAVEHAASLAQSPAHSGGEASAEPILPGPVSGHPEVRLDANGRFVVRGFSFSTLDQAADYAARLSKPIPQPMRQAHATAAEVVAPAAVAPAPRPAPAGASLQARAPKEGAPAWVSRRTSLSAGGTSFHADLVYYGTPVRYDPRHDCSRIDPTLPVDPRGDPSGATLDYWPSYAHLTPRARATYLGWLDGGRQDPSIPIGYVFLFFYGLEQRLLIDDARGEAAAIMAELRRLRGIYGENYSFAAYAAKLLALQGLYDEGAADEAPNVAWARNYELELPLDVRIRLGRRLRDGQTLRAEDCLRWVLALPNVSIRTAGHRCFDELHQLWLCRFTARFPQEMSVRRPRAMLKHHYRAASGTFVADVSAGDLPDIGGTTAPLTPLRAMLDTCIDDLGAYSRLLGREPQAKGQLQADLLLPPELRQTCSSLAACRERLAAIAERELLSGVSIADVARLLDIACVDGEARIAGAALRQIGLALDALDHGFEPDRRYGAAGALRANTPVALFPAIGGGPVDHERAAYVAARTMVEVAMLAAASDGEVVAAEVQAIERRLRAMPDLSEQEIVRLIACGRALAADPPKLRSALKRLSDVPAPRRSALAVSALEAVLADGRVTPEEVRFLEALHTALGLPVEGVYASLHRGGVEDLGPVTVSDGSPEEIISIPAEPVSTGGVTIDAARLERIRGETSKVSSLLASIFVEDEPESLPPPSRRKRQNVGAFAGLDEPHSNLLALLISAPMDRAAFEAAARELRLFPGGALDVINDWGFERFEAPVVEEDNLIYVSPDLIDQLQPAGASS